MNVTKTRPGPEGLSLKEKSYFDELRNQKYRMGNNNKSKPLKMLQSYTRSFDVNDYSCDLSEVASYPEVFNTLRFKRYTSKTSFRHYDGKPITQTREV